MTEENNPIKNLTASITTVATLTRKELRIVSEHMSEVEARFLVDGYYMAQADRIRTDNQVRSMTKSDEPNTVLQWMASHSAAREDLIKKALDEYTKHHPVGIWLRSIHGVGPVTSAGLLAHLDIRKAPVAGAFWKFGGIDGKTVWKKGEKRPWNADLKTLLYKIGEGFVKTCNNPDSVYGKIYKDRKALETQRNLAGEFRAQAEDELARKTYKPGTVTYLRLIDGKLSDAHIHARARRYAVKMFLSHLHHVMYNVILGEDPPKPYAIGILFHAHYVTVPNSDKFQKFVAPEADDIPDNESGDE